MIILAKCHVQNTKAGVGGVDRAMRASLTSLRRRSARARAPGDAGQGSVGSQFFECNKEGALEKDEWRRLKRREWARPKRVSRAARCASGIQRPWTGRADSRRPLETIYPAGPERLWAGVPG